MLHYSKHSCQLMKIPTATINQSYCPCVVKEQVFWNILHMRAKEHNTFNVCLSYKAPAGRPALCQVSFYGHLAFYRFMPRQYWALPSDTPHTSALANSRNLGSIVSRCVQTTTKLANWQARCWHGHSGCRFNGEIAAPHTYPNPFITI